MGLVIKARIDQDGYLRIEQKVDMPPGEVDVEIREPSRIRSLDAIRQRLKEIDEQGISDEQIESTKQYTRELLAAARDDLDLPPDYADEIDHYLYGTPKRSESKDSQ